MTSQIEIIQNIKSSSFWCIMPAFGGRRSCSNH